MPSPRDKELQALVFSFHKKMEVKNMTLDERQCAVSTLVGLHLAIAALSLDEPLNIVSNRFFSKILEANEDISLPFAQSHNLPIRP